MDVLDISAIAQAANVLNQKSSTIARFSKLILLYVCFWNIGPLSLLRMLLIQNLTPIVGILAMEGWVFCPYKKILNIV